MGGAAGATLVFVQTAVYGHFLEPTQYGALSLLTTMQLALSGILTFGLDSALTRLYFDYVGSESQIRILLGSVMAAWATLAGVLAIPTWAAMSWIVRGGGPGILELVPYVIATSMVMSLVAILQGLLVAEQQPLGYVAVANGAKIAVLGGTAVALTITPSVRSQVLAQLGATVAFGLVACAVWGKRFTGRPRRTISLDGARLGLPLILYASSGLLFGFFDRYLLERYHGFAPVGLYSMGQMLAQGISLVMVAMARVWTPLFLGRETSGRDSVPEFALAGSVFVGLAAGLSALLGLFSREILTVMGKDAYLLSEPMLRVLAVAYVVSASYYVDWTVLYRFKRIWLLAGITIASGLVNVIGDLLLIPRWSGIGASLGSVMTLVSMAVMLRLAARREYSGRFHIAPIGRMMILGTVTTLVIPMLGLGFLARTAILLALWSALAAEVASAARRSGYEVRIQQLVRQAWRYATRRRAAS